jgi:ribA/ribD-fused uncharacterized protein
MTLSSSMLPIYGFTSMENAIFFCSHKPNGVDMYHVFSQWFVANDEFKDVPNCIYDLSSMFPIRSPRTRSFKCREQALMFYKSLLFTDTTSGRGDITDKIMMSTNPSEIKELGRQIKNYDDDVWSKIRYKIAVNINYMQFSQNREMKNILLSSNTNYIVEAAHYDRIWGIGFDKDNAMANISSWGTNLLGNALMEVRAILRDQEYTIK